MKYNIFDYFKFYGYSRNVINMLYWSVLIFFGFKRSNKPIPSGCYCYTPDYVDTNPFVYHVKPCKYYKRLGFGYNGCSYLGKITDDFIFDDQCKLCNENYELS